MNLESLPNELITYISSFCTQYLWFLSRTNKNIKKILFSYYRNHASCIKIKKSPYIYRIVRVYNHVPCEKTACLIVKSFETKLASLQSLYLLNHVSLISKVNKNLLMDCSPSLLALIIKMMITFDYSLDSFKFFYSKFLKDGPKKYVKDQVKEMCFVMKKNREDIISFLEIEDESDHIELF